MSRRQFEEYNEGDLSEHQEEDYDYEDKPQCLCMDRKTGMIVGAAIPGVVMVFQSILKWTLTAAASTGVSILAQGFFANIEVSFTACGLVTGLGLGAVFMGENGKYKSTLVGLWLWAMTFVAMVLIVTGFETAEQLSLGFFQKELVDGKEKYTNIVDDSNFAGLKSVSVSVLDEATRKGKNVATYFIIKAFNAKTMDQVLVSLCLHSEFTAYLLGTLPALVLLVVSAYIYGYAVSLQCRLFPVKQPEAEKASVAPAAAALLSFTPY